MNPPPRWPFHARRNLPTLLVFRTSATPTGQGVLL